MPVKFTITKSDDRLLGEVVNRVQREMPAHLGGGDTRPLRMDLTATHANGCPLDFAKLLDFPPGDFAHDIIGIARHLDRQTGKLTDCFLPRCAKPESERRATAKSWPDGTPEWEEVASEMARERHRRATA